MPVRIRATQTRHATVAAIVWLLGWGALALAAGREPLFPTQLRLTVEECRQINQKHTLDGVPVISPVPEYEVVWEHSRVLAGTRDEVLGSFLSKYRIGLGGSRDVRNPRSYLHDRLCHRLLRSGDGELVRAVVWNYALFFPTGYLRADWARLKGDRTLSPAGRLVVWVHWWTVDPPRGDGPEIAKRSIARADTFWRELGPQLRSEDLVRVMLDAEWGPHALTVPVRVADVWNVVFWPPALTQERAEKLMLPMVRRQYLSYGPLVCSAARRVWRFPALRKPFLARLVEFDAAGDTRGILLWNTFEPRSVDDASARTIRTLAFSARLWQVAGRAFWAYRDSPAGRREAAADRGAALLRTYLRTAFAKKTPDEQVDFLRGLVDTRDGSLDLLSMLRRGRVDITVTPDQFELLKLAWGKDRRALDYVIVEEKE